MRKSARTTQLRTDASPAVQDPDAAGRAARVHELGAFFGALPLASRRQATATPFWCCQASWLRTSRREALRTFLKTHGYAVSGWRLGRNLGLRDGVQEAMVDLVHELSDTHGRTVSLVGWLRVAATGPRSQALRRSVVA